MRTVGICLLLFGKTRETDMHTPRQAVNTRVCFAVSEVAESCRLLLALKFACVDQCLDSALMTAWACFTGLPSHQNLSSILDSSVTLSLFRVGYHT